MQPEPELVKKLPVGVSEGTRLCRLNIVSSLFASILIFIMFLIRLNIEGLMSVSLYSLLAASIIIFTLPFVIKRTANYQIANIIILTVTMVVLPIRVIDTGGLSSAVMSWYMGTGLIFFVIGSVRLGLMAYFISMVELFMIYLSIKFSWVRIDFKPSDDIQYWVFSLAFTLSVFVIYGYEKQRRKNIQVLEEKNQIISLDNEMLAQQKVELEKADLDKSTLLNVLCHDVANPLHVIKSYAEMMEEENPSNIRVKNITKAASVIEQIIDHLRTLQVISSETDEIKLKPVKLSDCIEQAEFVFESQLKEKNLTINTNINKTSSVDVLADPVSLTNSVINNVISNAIKFSERNQSIDIYFDREGEYVHLTIQDHGVGMPVEMVENLFSVDKFQSRPGTEGETGTGLGMKVMASYINSYGGRIEVESKTKETDAVHHGTVFHLWLKSGSE